MTKRIYCTMLLTFCMAMAGMCQDKQSDSNVMKHVRNIVEQEEIDKAYVVVMDMHTGEIIDSMSLGVNNDAWLHNKIPTRLLSVASLGIAIDKCHVTFDDSVDTGNGLYKYKDETIREHNWARGGYGKCTLKQALIYPSVIGAVKTVEKAITDNAEYSAAFKELTDLDVTDADFLRYEFTPIQICNAYSRMATAKGSSANTILQLEKELGHLRYILKNNQDVLGYLYFYKRDAGIIVELCGSFPKENPRYTVFVQLSKEAVPHSPSVAGSVFLAIYHSLISK